MLEKLNEYVTKLHSQTGRVAPAATKRTLSAITGLPLSSGRACEKVCKSCTACEQFGAAPQISKAGRLVATIFILVVELDLICFGPSPARPVVDVTSLYTQVRLLKSKGTMEVWKMSQQRWIAVFCRQNRVQMYSGGEFYSNAGCDLCAAGGIAAEYRPKGSHAFVAEWRNHFARSVVESMLAEHAEWSLEGIVSDVGNAINDLVGASGFRRINAFFAKV